MADELRYTQAELEEIFRRRMRDQDDLIGKVAERAVGKLLDVIKPEFELVNRRIGELTEQVKKTNGQVSRHGRYFENLGVPEMSLDEQQALPEVVDDHLRLKQNRKEHDHLERRRIVRDQALTTFISTAAGIVVAGGALVGILHAAGVIH